MKSLAVALLVAASTAQAQAPAQATPATAATGQVAVTVRDDAGKPVADAVVVAVPVDGTMRLPAKREAVIDQVDKQFAPVVSVITAGTAVHFPNHDDVRHQVYSFSKAKRFELPLYSGVPAQPVVFDTPGVVVLGCNIHDWMIGYVYVSESPWFARTGADGTAVIADLPPKRYTLRAWHPQQEGPEDATRQIVDVTAAHRAQAAWTMKLKPPPQVRRAPVGGHAGHY